MCRRLKDQHEPAFFYPSYCALINYNYKVALSAIDMQRKRKIMHDIGSVVENKNETATNLTENPVSTMQHAMRQR